MLEAFWAFVSNAENQKTLTWIGGGIVIVATGLWKALKKDKPEKKDKPTVSATSGSVAFGDNAAQNKVTIHSK